MVEYCVWCLRKGSFGILLFAAWGRGYYGHSYFAVFRFKVDWGVNNMITLLLNHLLHFSRYHSVSQSWRSFFFPFFFPPFPGIEYLPRDTEHKDTAELNTQIQQPEILPRFQH